jgi:S-adenosylmethionine/arginine decarboxylase-like enzyme
LSDGFTHLIADFIGVNPAFLRDGSMITGLLIAAASAAGFAAIGNPLVRQATDESVSAVLMLDNASRLSVQTMPARSVLLFDLLSPASHDGRRALDVFVRRLSAKEVRSDQRQRG